MNKKRFKRSKLTSIFLFATLIFSGLTPITLFTNAANAASASVVVDPATYSGSGTTITDTVSSINGTMSNVTFEAATNCGVFNYNGSNSAIQFPQRNFGTAFSISTWIRASEGATSGQPQFNIQTLMSNVGANVAPSGFKVFINNWNSNDGKLIHQAGNGSTGTDVYTNSSNLVAINQWHHIVFTFNQSSPAVTIYKDGTKLGTTGTPVSSIGMNNSNWWLGSMGGNSYWYKGKMGVTKIYSTILSDAEVVEDYNSTSLRYGSNPSCGVSAPTNVGVTAGQAALDVTWGAPTELNGRAVTGYQVEYSTNGTSSWTTASSSIASNATSYTISGLTAQTSYYVRVAAKHAGGLSAYGYPWTEIHRVTSPIRSSDLIQYESGFGIGAGTRQATYANSDFTRIRYRMDSRYNSTNYYVESDFNRSLGTAASYSETFDSIEKLQVPSIAGTNAQFEIQANVSDLNVQSNEPSVVDGQGMNGRIEFWPWNYEVSAPSGLSDRQAIDRYADADSPSQLSPPSSRGNYGSFQLHTLSGTPSTVFAWNRHFSANSSQTDQAEIGFGSYTGLNSDWTFCINAGASPGCTGRSNFALKIYINVPTTTLAIATRTITYALNSGTGTAPTQADTAQGSTFTVASGSGISRSGFTFAGWSDGTTVYQPTASYTVGGSNVTLTAQWTANDPTTTTFNATGAAQTWTVPAGIISVSFSITGGSGGDTHGGKGATVTGTLAVTAGETLQINVGARGGTYPGGSTSNWTSAAFGGGGRGNYYGSGGGGASDIRKGSYALADRVAVAGGGGGGAQVGSYFGGAGGTTSGARGEPATATGLFGAGGAGGTQAAGGAGGVGASQCGNTAGSNGTLGVGGDGANASSGAAGGGGGYYGGGGGGSGCNPIAGGGGSSWVSSSLVTSALYSVAASLSAGTISITYGGLAPTLTGAAISGTASQGQTLTASVQGAAGGTASSTTYQWSRADTSTGTYTNISGATSSTYVLTLSDVGKFVKVLITVSNSIGSNSSTSSATSAVAAVPPTITSLSVTRGSTAGGTVVTITGTNLSGVTGITFGGTAGTSISSNTSTSVTVTTPANSAGAVNVVLTGTEGSVTSTGAFTYALTNGSIAFSGSNYIWAPASSDFNFGTGDFTVEWWQKFDPTNSGGAPRPWSFGVYPSSRLQVSFEGNVAYTAIGSNWILSPTIPAAQYRNVWSHWALVRNNGVAKLYFNGVATNNGVANTTNLDLSALKLFVGTEDPAGYSTTKFAGNISEFRIVKSAVYTNNFVPPVGVTNISNTIVLLNAKREAFITDGSSSARTFTNVSTANSAADYPLVPTITSLSTTTGTTSGGTSVTITGTNLSSTSAISFGGTAGTSITSNTSTSVTITTPARSTGIVDVILTTVGGSVLSAGAFTFGSAPTLTGAAISGTASQGQTLTASIQGAGGSAATTTTYQWSRADTSTGTYTNISGATSSTYVLTSDDFNKYLKVTISVSNSAGGPNSATSSATAQIAAQLTAPTLTGAAISGTTTQGQTLTASIQGAGGGTATTTTYQWSRADTSTGTYSNISGATSSTYLLASADATKFIKVTISVSNSAGGPNSATSSATNQIAIIAPTIGSATFSGTTTVGQTLTATANSLGGGAVASTGYQWRSATTAAGVYSDISGATSSTYVLTANEAGKYIRVVITVTNSAGNASATSSASSAAVISNVPTPTISSISPNAGTTAGGTSVTISGTNLSTVTAVTFDGTAATISTKTTTQLVVTTPAHAAGSVDVVVTNTAGSVTSANGFTYANTPTTRSWTATPTITSGANGDPFSVTYQAVCTTPQRFGPAMYDLIYITPGVWIYNTYMGSGTSTDGGYTWTITKNYTINSNGIWKIDAYQRGACWGTSNFVYATQNIINVGISGPTITSLNTTSGPTAGGTATTITGTNLTGVTGITVGGAAATSIRSNTSTSVTFNTPAGTAGAKNVVVTTTAGSVTGTNAFTYVAPITITYDVNGGSGSPSRTSDSYTPNTGGFSVPVVGTMSRSGYTFGGWATANNSNTAITSPYNPTSSLTVFAIWTAINYTNTYNANGATGGSAPSSTTNAFGSTVTVAGNSGSLARTGFTLAGWNTLANGTGTSYNLGSGTFTQGAGNQILYADWIPDTYAVSYDVNGSSDAVPAAHTGKLANSSVTLAAGVTKTNFAFVGWESGGITYRAGATFIVGSANATVVAKWIEVFKLSYNLNGTGASGSVPADFQYVSGDTVTVTSVVPTRGGYTFGGWINQSGGAHATSSTYAISATNYLLYAVWNPVAYTVTYALNGGQGTAPTESSKNINNTFTVAAAPTKIGSTFTGWSNGSTVFGAGSSYLVGTADITLTAQWSANSYTVTYDLAQGTSSVPSAVSKNYQANWNLPDAPTRVGFNFADWYDGTNGYAAGASYTLGTATDLTITARWNAIVFYTVTYDLDGGLGNAPTQDPLQNGQTFTLPADPAKTGNSFTGWSYAGTTYSSGQVIPMPAANITVTALWTATSAGTFAITYITNGAQTTGPTIPPLSENATFTIDDGSGLIRNGYIFSGWTRNGTTYLGGETFTMPASSVTFSAVWVPSVRATAVSHSVDANSITKGRSITVTYNLGCFVSSGTIPTIFENVSTTGESFVNNITSSLTVIDAGYNWTVTRVYTLSLAGTYTIFATASGGCFSASTNSTSSTVTVTEAPSVGTGASSGAGTPAPAIDSASTSARTGSIQPVTVVGARIALVANRTYTLPKLSAPTLSVEARTGASSSSSTTTTQTNGTSLTTTTMLSVNSASKGLSEVKIVENQIAVVPTVGFSGKTDVTVTVTDGTSTTTITVPVTVLPEPVKDPVITPVAARQTSVTWEPSPNADSYQVIVDGKTACRAATDSCEVKKILGPNADVQVIANGGDATKSDAVEADYEADKTVVLSRLVGTTKSATLTPNDIKMLNKVIATVKAQGFETVTISQITTNKVNSAAAKARIAALVNYVKTRSGDPDLVVKVVPAPAKSSMNQIAVK